MTKFNFRDAVRIIIVAILLSTGVAYAVGSWQAPAQPFNPTAGSYNVDAPINVGSKDQTKGNVVTLDPDPAKRGAITTAGALWSKSMLGTEGGGFFGGGLVIGSTLKPANIQIIDGEQGPGKVLTSTANGYGYWADPAGVVSVGTDTGNDCIISNKTTEAFTGYISVSMLKNGKNLCTDTDGCRYGILKYDLDNTNIPYAVEYASDQTFFQQPNPLTGWKDFGGGQQEGANGNGIDTLFRDFGLCDLYDDSSAENSRDNISLRDSNSSYGCALLICDSGM